MLLSRRPPVESSAVIGPVAREAVKPFDVDPQSVNLFCPFVKPDLPPFQMGLIVGSSGSGKSTLLREFGPVAGSLEWDDRSIADYFDSPTAASEAFYAAGLGSVPLWLLSFSELSNGEQFRATLARQMKSDALIDEFTSVVDRHVAISASVSVSRYIKRKGLRNVVFATCHRDIIEWLSPDWVIDTDAGELFFETHKPLTWYKQFITEPRVGELVVE